MKSEPIEWETSEKEPDRWFAESGCLNLSLDQWTGEDAARLYLELDVETVDEGKRLGEHLRQAIESFYGNDSSEVE